MNERHGDIFNDNDTVDSGKGSELQLFSFNVVVAVTKNFSESNMIGKGGFGLVYKVWELWKEDRILELIDSSMNISTSKGEVLRCIQVGILCVQEKAIDRPNMSSVIYMLSDERIMPSPKQPAFSFWKENCSDHPQSSTNSIDGCSRNEITITDGVPYMKPNSILGFDCVSTPDEVYYTYEMLSRSLISTLVLNRTGHIGRYTWDLESNDSTWKLNWSAPNDQCDEYSKCGPNGICNVTSSSVCGCVKGFEPKTPKEWNYVLLIPTNQT
ncbi:G-type lectin S-receptor-like serine/threonine-protein kinase isoform X4 [Cinnamomum micranthum f. kanehirae]|uniref:G-type lectin S-receptor-like serine/threonine-protein kinase isoform X4 n=1 Tax=Cinnamomum micranthum f. kanehirae TaxID=337451 RepID=A0A443PBL5_9MAGN|nr:G-type lectin S-receptor-like serine/threonine-protein kinase isoform X4 [Cinnamomum micranthum f. kanehirae]